MPDLSSLLGAVYGGSPSSAPRDPEDEAHVEHEPAATERGPAVPDWADDEHLDAAFAQWKPGPSSDASPVEHAFAKDADDDPPPPLADDLAAALSEALVASSGAADDTDHADVADANAYGGPKPKAYDFSLVDDEVEPAAQVQPVHEIDEAAGVEDDKQKVAPVAQAQPLHEVEPVDQVEGPAEPVVPAVPELHAKPEVPELHAKPELPELHAEPEAAAEPEAHEVEDNHEVEDHKVEAAEADDDEADDDTDASVTHVQFAPVDDGDHLRRPAPITAQREAAAELTAASRTEAESPFAPPSPEPEPVPVASAPSPVVAATPEPPRAPVAVATASVPGDMRRWERSDDDILPEKQSKKFFSLSLRRG